MAKGAELWDDSALINAFDAAMTSYKEMHTECFSESAPNTENDACNDKENSTILTGDDKRERQKIVAEGNSFNVENNITETCWPSCGSAAAVDDAFSQEFAIASNCSVPAFNQFVSDHPCANPEDGGHSNNQNSNYNDLLKQYYELEQRKERIVELLWQSNNWNSETPVQCPTSLQQQLPWGYASEIGPNTTCPWCSCQCLSSFLNSISKCPPAITLSSGYACYPQQILCSSDSQVQRVTGGARCSTDCSKCSVVTPFFNHLVKGDGKSVEAEVVPVEVARNSAKEDIKRTFDFSEGKINCGDDELGKELSSDSSTKTNLTSVVNAWYWAGYHTGRYLLEQKQTDKLNKASPSFSEERECLAEPLEAQYGGGIISSQELSRSTPYQNISVQFLLQKDRLYTLSAWLKTDASSADVVAFVKTGGGEFVNAGAVEARPGCWSMLKGGFQAEFNGPTELFFQSNATESKVWVDSVSLQPFTTEEWRSHQSRSIRRSRTKPVRMKAVYAADGSALPNATVSIKLQRRGFPFGCAVAQTILTNPAYQRWFASRGFTVTTFDNEMKWYSTEWSRWKEDYRAADAMLAFAKQHRVAVRGHNIFWDDPRYQPQWVPSLSDAQLKEATARRLASVVSRYKGQLVAWDVVNENLHFNFFEQRLGPRFSADAFAAAGRIDPGTPLFLNEFNTLEQPGDAAAAPDKYLKKLREIRSYTKGGVRMAIGLESHFSQPNIPYMRAALDKLATANVPIWLTEVDVYQGPNQAQYLEAILREGFAHPAVQGIVVWGGWRPEGCSRMCLTDNSFKNLPAGDVVDGLLKEWGAGGILTADESGFLEVPLFHGEYSVDVVRSPAAGRVIVVDNQQETASEPEDGAARVVVVR